MLPKKSEKAAIITDILFNFCRLWGKLFLSVLCLLFLRCKLTPISSKQLLALFPSGVTALLNPSSLAPRNVVSSFSPPVNHFDFPFDLSCGSTLSLPDISKDRPLRLYLQKIWKGCPDGLVLDPILITPENLNIFSSGPSNSASFLLLNVQL